MSYVSNLSAVPDDVLSVLLLVVVGVELKVEVSICDLHCSVDDLCFVDDVTTVLDRVQCMSILGTCILYHLGVDLERGPIHREECLTACRTLNVRSLHCGDLDGILPRCIGSRSSSSMLLWLLTICHPQAIVVHSSLLSNG